MYREGANNAVKNVQDGTLHMKEQNTIVNLSSSQDLSQCLFWDTLIPCPIFIICCNSLKLFCTSRPMCLTSEHTQTLY